MMNWGVYERPTKEKFVLYSPHHVVPVKLDIGELVCMCESLREASQKASDNPRLKP